MTVWADKKRPKIGGTREAVVMNFSPAEGVEWAEIKDKLKTSEEVGLNVPM